MKVAEDLKKYFIGKDLANGCSFFLISNANRFSQAEPELLEKILLQCEGVESQVWAKKFSIYHSTFDLDFVVLIYNNEDLVGFASAGLFTLADRSRLGFYISEVMILKSFQQRGLAKKALFSMIARALKQGIGLQELSIIVLSGHFGLFKSFLSLKELSLLSPQDLEGPDLDLIMNYLARDIEDCEVQKTGLVHDAWAEQKVETNFIWPRDLAKAYDFPEKVNLADGDALLRIFRSKALALDALRLVLDKYLSESLC